MKIPGGSTYTISFGNIQNYSTPVDNNSYKAVAGSSNNLNYVYNACLLTFSFTPNTASAIVSYNNTTVSNGHSLLVPFESISVNPIAVDGYKNPNDVSFTPSTSSMEISMVWEEENTEIAIVDIEGWKIPMNQWKSGDEATGVYINDGTHEIIVAPTIWYTDPEDPATNTGNYFGGDELYNDNRSHFGGQGTIIENCYLANSMSDSYSDFNGRSNTKAIITTLRNTSDGFSIGAPAAEYCALNYSRGLKRQGEWYLPASGEMKLIMDNFDAVKDALSKINGAEIPVEDQTYVLWTSTQTGYCPSSFIGNYSEVYYTSNRTANSATRKRNAGVWPVCDYSYGGETTGECKIFAYSPSYQMPGRFINLSFSRGQTWRDYVNSSWNTHGLTCGSSDSSMIGHNGSTTIYWEDGTTDIPGTATHIVALSQPTLGNLTPSDGIIISRDVQASDIINEFDYYYISYEPL